MRRAALGSILFFVLAPGVVGGLVPWLIARMISRGAGSSPGLQLSDVVGGGLLAGGAGIVIACFAQFVREGHGTPSPTAPTDTLVVGGLYRHVRNPMYVGVAAMIAGQALLFRSVAVVWWLVAFVAAVTTFVVAYEQPTLSRQYGASYERYRREVPAWWPRFRPWRP
jgi:protein-S-isoprenylcysteine O-methyltransferase Ste14